MEVDTSCAQLAFGRGTSSGAVWRRREVFGPPQVSSDDVAPPCCEEVTSDEDEDGLPKPRRGAGVWGFGPPLHSKLMRVFTDGAGPGAGLPKIESRLVATVA